MEISMPKGLTVAALSLALCVFTGCGGAPFTGSLTDGPGNGSGPTPPTGQAEISSLTPSTIPAGSAAFTLTATGANFVQGTAILWNNTTLTTTYVSSTEIQAQVPASLVAAPTSVTLIPTPQVSLNFGATFTVAIPPLTGNPLYAVAMVPVEANDMVLNPATQQLYLSVSSINATNPKSILTLDPQTVKLGTAVSTTAEPTRLAISSDGAYLYAGLNTTSSIQRLTLPALQPDVSIPLGSGSLGPYYAIDIEPDPTSPHTIAVSRGVRIMSPPGVGGVILYDDAVARPQSIAGSDANASATPIDSLVWNPNGQALYGADTETSSSGFFIMSVTSSGLQLASATQPAIATQGGGIHFEPTTGYVYTDSGQIIDPATDTIVGTFPLSAIQGGPGSFVMVPDAKLNIAYFVGQTSDESNTGNYVIEAYDLTHFTFLGAMPLTITNTSGSPTRAVRWGTDGLAILTGDPSRAGGPTSGDGVYLVTGGFVASPAP
jgi:hypothetical protein